MNAPRPSKPRRNSRKIGHCGNKTPQGEGVVTEAIRKARFVFVLVAKTDCWLRVPKKEARYLNTMAEDDLIATWDGNDMLYLRGNSEEKP
jgi:hypothetical protein